MGTYSKDISMKDVKEYYDSLINGIKELQSNISSIGLSYIILCLYEYLILKICIGMRDSGKLRLRETEGNIIINISDVYKCYKNKDVHHFMRRLMTISNTLRHSFNERIFMNKSFLDLLFSRYTNDVLDIILGNEDVELKRFLKNKRLLNRISDELYRNSTLKMSCDEIVNFYIKNSSNGKIIECIINEMMRSSGCSFKFACVEFVKCTRKEVIDF